MIDIVFQLSRIQITSSRDCTQPKFFRIYIFYLELLVLVNLNNEVNELIENEKEEIQRILRMLCMKIYDNFDLINISVKNIYLLEFIFGTKASYANEIKV